MTSKLNNKARLNRSDQIDFLRDFDLLTAISAEQKPLYDPANIELAQKMMSSSYVLKQDNSQFGLGCHIDQFKHFGPGIYLLFKFLKFLTIVFGIVSILALISVLLLVAGPTPRDSHITNQIKGGILKTTVFNLTADDSGYYVGINFAITVVMSIMMVYWSEKERSYVLSCLKVAPLASYSTVILKKLPEHYNEHELQVLLSNKFGEIAEIYTVRNFGDDLLSYKEMTQIVQQYKQQKVITSLYQDRTSHRITSLFFSFRSGHLKMKQKIKNSMNYKPCFAFIQFKKVEDKQKLIEHHVKVNFLSCFRGDQDRKSQIQNNHHGFGGYRLEQLQFSQCEMQPGGILWQNLHLTKTNIMIKTGLMILLMIIVLTLSIFLIYLLCAVQMSLMNSKFKDSSRTQILTINDNFALLSYCTNLSLSQFYQQSDICSKYNTQYIKLTIMIFMIPLSISLFKLILTQIMKQLVIFRRYAYEIRKIQSQSMIIFVFYFFVTGVLQLVIYLGHDDASVFELFTPMIQAIVNSDFKPQKITLFSDFTPNWYITASYNITIIAAISFNISAIGIILYCKIRSKLYRYFAKKCKLQIQMNSWLQGYTLEIEYIYATILTIIYFTLLFGGSMPLLYLLAFGSFFVFFWSYKWVFVKFCARPLIYNHSINRKAINMVFGALIMHCFFTPIFYAAPGIGQGKGHVGVFQRIVAYWQYLFLMILLILYVFFEKPARILFSIIKSYRIQHNSDKKSVVGQDPPLPYHPQRKNFSLPTIIRKKQNQQTLESYSMHQNEHYKDILRTLYTINNKQRARKTCVLNKQLMHLYEDNIKQSENDDAISSRSLVEVIKVVRRDFKKYQQKNNKGRNPFLATKTKLYHIYEHSKKGHNHKYTLRLTTSKGINEMYNNTEGLAVDDQIIQEVMEPSIQDQEDQGNVDNQNVMQEEICSVGLNTKDSFCAAGLASCNQAPLVEGEDNKYLRPPLRNKQSRGRQSSEAENLPLPQKIKKNLVDLPQLTDQRLNNSKF